MKRILLASSALALIAANAHAAGLDRSNQDTSAIFNDSGSVSFSFGHVMPSVTGKDAAGNKYNVGKSYNQIGLSWTQDINEAFSYTVILDQPYGAHVEYNNDPTTSALGGTMANLSSKAVSVIGKYQINPNISVYGGVKIQRIDGKVRLNGTSYANAISVAGVTNAFNAQLPGGAPQLSASALGGALGGDPAQQGAFVATYAPVLGGALQAQGALQNLGTQVQGAVGGFNATGGYRFDMESSTAAGALIGAAYEIPDIAFRLAATYHFEKRHKADTVEHVLGGRVNGDIEFVTPQALNIDFQTGIATDTLLTASYRWAQYSKVDLIPDRLASDLVNLDDARRWTLGLARRFNDAFAASVTYSFEPSGDDLVSPLGPTNGLHGISIGGRYEKDGLTISGGINYSMLGDAKPQVGGVAQAKFKDNTSTAFGFRVSYEF